MYVRPNSLFTMLADISIVECLSVSFQCTMTANTGSVRTAGWFHSGREPT
jgi:hypothetical protein